MTKPWMPTGASPWFWASVVGCSLFWLVAYALIIRQGLRDRSFGMPLAAMCWNISWEILFSTVYPPEYRLIEVGNKLWTLADVVIVWIAWKHAPADFPAGWTRAFVRPGILAGVVLATAMQVPFAHEYHDMNGYLLGWMAALMMSVLFVAMLLRRNSLAGQSLWIALGMLGGNFWAWVWVKYYPHPAANAVLAPGINTAFLLATGAFNLLYVILVYRRARELGLNPWALAPTPAAAAG